MAQAVSPPPDGGYPGQNTAEGEKALFSLSLQPTAHSTQRLVGVRNRHTATFYALNITGSLNTGRWRGDARS